MTDHRDPRPGASLEERLRRDAERLTGPPSDVVGGLQFWSRPRRVRREAYGRRLARAAVCGALVVFLLVGADERAGLRGAGRFVPTAQSRLETPIAPAAAVKELAAFLSGDHPLDEEWNALSRDAEGLLDEFTKRVAPLANVVKSVDVGDPPE